MLPGVEGLRGLDIGEGHNTRLPRHNLQQEKQERSGIEYCAASGQALPFAGDVFDFVTAFMSVMDVPEPAALIAEAYRVLKPSAFSSSPSATRVSIRPIGRTGANGEIDEWIFRAAPASAKAA